MENCVATVANSVECWVSTQDKIVSFHAVPNYLHKVFEESKELMDYILNDLDGKGYRFQ